MIMQESYTLIVQFEGTEGVLNAQRLKETFMDNELVSFVAAGPGFPDIDVGKLNETGWEKHEYAR